jgi:hypothetical protein
VIASGKDADADNTILFPSGFEEEAQRCAFEVNSQATAANTTLVSTIARAADVRAKPRIGRLCV